MTTKKNIAKEVFWVSLGQLVSALLMLGTMKVWAVYLQPSQLGLMALTIGIPSMILGIFLQPIFQAVLILYPNHHSNDTSMLFRMVCNDILLKITMVICLVILFVGFPLIRIFELSIFLLPIVIVLLVVDCYRVYHQMLFAASRSQIHTAIISVGDVALRLMFLWACLHFYEASAESALIGVLIGGAIFALFMKVFMLQNTRAAKSISMNLSKENEIEMRSSLSRIARPLIPSMILSNITEMGNRYFIGATIGLEAAGIFVVAYGLIKRPFGMLNHVGEMAMTPLVRESINNNDHTSVSKTRSLWLIGMFMTSALCITAVYFMKEEIVSVFLSSSYNNVASLLPGLAVAIGLYNISNIFSWFSLTLGNATAVLHNNIVGCVTTVILTIVLSFTVGLIGAVIALLLGYFVQLLTSIITYRLAAREVNDSTISSATKTTQ